MVTRVAVVHNPTVSPMFGFTFPSFSLPNFLRRGGGFISLKASDRGRKLALACLVFPKLPAFLVVAVRRRLFVVPRFVRRVDANWETEIQDAFRFRRTRRGDISPRRVEWIRGVDFFAPARATPVFQCALELKSYIPYFHLVS